MTRRVGWAWLAAASLLAAPAAALDPGRPLAAYVRTVWRDELPQATVQAIAQAEDGYLWLGTWGGLVRFDGVEFKVSGGDAAAVPPNAAVLTLAPDGQGGLWAGTMRNGLYRVSSSGVTSWSKAQGLGSEQVHRLLVDRTGAVWIGSIRGVQRLRGGRLETFGAEAGFGNEIVYGLAETPDGTIWAGSSGLRAFRGGRWERVPVGGPGEFRSVTRLLAAPDGTLWVGTHQGLARLEKGGDRAVPVPGDPVTTAVLALACDSDGSVWIGTEGEGLLRWRGGRFEQLRSRAVGSATDFVVSLAEDRERNLWVGTRGGLMRLKNGSFRAYGTENGLVGEFVRTVYEDAAGRIWTGTDGGGLHVMEGDRFVPVNDTYRLHTTRIRSIGGDTEGGIWVGTSDAGLVRIHGGRSVRYGTADGLVDPYVRTILGTPDGDVWVGTARGLVRLRGGKVQLPDPFTSRTGGVNALLLTRDGTIVAGTGSRGVVARKGDAVAALTTEDGLAANTVFALHEDADGTVWVGTADGLSCWRGGKVTTFRSRQAFEGDQVFSIREDGLGSLWFSNNQGVYRIARRQLLDAADGKPGPVEPTLFGPSDGLPSRQCNGTSEPASLRSRDGRLWFPTAQGLAVVDPARLERNAVPPPVLLQRVLVDGQERGTGPSVVLAPGARHFEVGFAALAMAAPERVVYRLRLEGLDGQWRESTRRQVEYTTLPPGHYRFQVTAQNGDGVWAAAPAELSVEVRPSLGQRPLFWALLVAAAVAAGVGGYRVRVRSLARAKEAAEAASRAKSAFLASMSHEIRTPLNAVLGFSQLLLGDAGLTARQREQLETIVRSGEHLLRLINDVLEMSKIEAGRTAVRASDVHLRHLLWDLESTFRLRTDAKGLTLEVEAAGLLPDVVSADEGKLRQILINLLGNAVKFTAEGGVKLRVGCAPRVPGRGPEPAPLEAGREALLRAEVEDTGQGIGPEELPRLFERFEQARAGKAAGSGTGLGLAISRAFARLMGGDLTAESTAGKGSTFRLQVPVSVVALHAGSTAEVRRGAALRLAPDEAPRRLLVADDVAENREVLRGMLERAGFEVRVAADGHEALREHAVWTPHLVLMDVRMPGLDGLDATRQIRAGASGASGARVPIVAVTANAFEEDRQQAEAAGCDGFVSKPFREAELLGEVSRLLGVRMVEGASGPGASRQPARAAAIPEAWREPLREAVLAADMERVLQIAAELETTSPAAAQVVRDLTEGFEYDRLLGMLGAGPGPAP